MRAGFYAHEFEQISTKIGQFDKILFLANQYTDFDTLEEILNLSYFSTGLFTKVQLLNQDYNLNSSLIYN